MTDIHSHTTSSTSGSPPSGGKDTREQARDEARKTAETGKHKAAEVADEAKSQTSQLARTAGDEARQRADGELDKLAGALSRLGDELDEMADGSSHPNGYVTALARDGARTANRLSQRLESGGLDGAVNEVKTFARRRPGTFLAAAVGVGLALGRVTRNADMQAIKEGMDGSHGSEGADRSGSFAGSTGTTGTTGSTGSTGSVGSQQPPTTGQPVSTGDRLSP